MKCSVVEEIPSNNSNFEKGVQATVRAPRPSKNCHDEPRLVEKARSVGNESYDFPQNFTGSRDPSKIEVLNIISSSLSFAVDQLGQRS